MLRSLFPDGATDNQSASVCASLCVCERWRGQEGVEPESYFFFFLMMNGSLIHSGRNKKKPPLIRLSSQRTLRPPLAVPLSPSRSGTLFCDKGLKKTESRGGKASSLRSIFHHGGDRFTIQAPFSLSSQVFHLRGRRLDQMLMSTADICLLQELNGVLG